MEEEEDGWQGGVRTSGEPGGGTLAGGVRVMRSWQHPWATCSHVALSRE